MKAIRSGRFLRGLQTLALTALVAGCGVADVTDPMDDDELVIAGVTIQEDGTTLASALGTEVNGRLDGQLENTSRLWSVLFLDDQGVSFTPFANEIMDTQVADESIAVFTQEGSFTGRLRGVAAGETAIVFRFLRDGTAVYTSVPIPISIIGPDIRLGPSE